MTLDQVFTTAIEPALAWLPPKMTSPEARVEMGAIGLQESKFEHRWQVIDANDPSRKGPARGLWQFERNGGVAGVMSHPASKDLARAACDRQGVPFEKLAVWQALEVDDWLAAVFARLLLWTDPGPLPMVTQVDAAWALYVRTWRPGKPHPEKWPGYHRAVRAFLGFP